MSRKIDRTGERRIMNCGMEAEIIEYNNSGDITVRFDDGAIVANRCYSHFYQGEIKNPNFSTHSSRPGCVPFKEKYIGLTKMMKCGMEATIVDYVTCRKIKIRFSDGAEKTCSLRNFKSCEVQNPNIVRTKSQNGTVRRIEHRLGQEQMQFCGMKATIIQYHNADNIDVIFDDKTIVKHKQYSAFITGKIQNPNCNNRQTSIGETAILYYLEPYGYKKAPRWSLKEYGLKGFEIDAFNKDKGIGIEYDGLFHQKDLERDVRKDNLFFQHFTRLIRLRDYHLPCDDKRVEYYKIDTSRGLSKEYEATLQQMFRNLNLPIDVNFKRDKDAIFDLLHKNSPIARLGEKRVMRNGLLAEIIKYRSASDIDVRFEDDVIVTQKSYGCFLHGSIAHPNIDPHSYTKRKTATATAQSQI